MTPKNWRIKNTNRETTDVIARRLNVSPLTAKLLVNLGLSEPKEAQSFLKPNLDDIHSPMLFDQMDQAVARVQKALIQQEKICCYGDYDVDGITGSSLLFNFFKLIGANAFPYIPNRLSEGYGLNQDAVEAIANHGCQLIITADCGIRSVDEVAYAKNLGMDVIITDHHEAGGQLPAAAAIINPKKPNCPYPFKGISGSGVALKLAWAVAENMNKHLDSTSCFKDYLIDSLSFATLGTIADMVPILDENRAIVKFGLEALKQTSNPGIRALIDISIEPHQKLTTETVAFQLAPRINAAGRLGQSQIAMRLFTTDSRQEALDIAHELDLLNKSRQEIEREQSQEAFAQAERLAKKYTHTMVLSHDSWHSGVIGIIASRILEKYYRPTFVISPSEKKENISKGSARSIEGVHLPEALASAHDLLVQYGGHSMAAGFEIKTENIDAFRDAVELFAKSTCATENLIPKVPIDIEVQLPQLSEDLISEVKLLEPFGCANPNPLFAARNCSVIGSPRVIGKNKNHLKFKITQHGSILNVIAFNFAERLDELLKFEKIDIAFYPNIEEWNGYRNISLQLKEFREAKKG